MQINNVKILLLLSLLSAFPPLSTDMYLPALPLLQETWNESLATINLTLAGFFIGYCCSLLVYGPLSDNYGRRPPLLAGIGVYIIASLICGMTGSAVSLIVFRILQGIGAAAASVLAMAISKDLYQGNERQKVLAYMAVIMSLAPMLAPIFGGWIMAWLSWQWVFFIQALIGLFAWGGVFFLEEPLKEPSKGTLGKALTMYFELMHNRKYLVLILLFSLIVLPHFSFIGSAANIYITRFHLSEQVFGYFFAFNALSIMSGSFLCSKIIKFVEPQKLLALSFAGIMVSGVIMYASIFPGPWGLAIPMALASFSFGLSRPPSNHIVLEQVDQGVGAASSLMIFLYFTMGAFAMWFISIGWADQIRALAVFAMVSGGCVLATWLLLPGLHSAQPDAAGDR